MREVGTFVVIYKIFIDINYKLIPVITNYPQISHKLEVKPIKTICTRNLRYVFPFQVPTRLDKDKLRDYAQLDERYEVECLSI